MNQEDLNRAIRRAERFIRQSTDKQAEPPEKQDIQAAAVDLYAALSKLLLRP